VGSLDGIVIKRNTLINDPPENIVQAKNPIFESIKNMNFRCLLAFGMCIVVILDDWLNC
jgi:hypothetical protein